MEQQRKPPVFAVIDCKTHFEVLRCDSRPDAPAKFRRILARRRAATYHKALDMARVNV